MGLGKLHFLVLEGINKWNSPFFVCQYSALLLLLISSEGLASSGVCPSHVAEGAPHCLESIMACICIRNRVRLNNCDADQLHLK